MKEKHPKNNIIVSLILLGLFLFPKLFYAQITDNTVRFDTCFIKLKTGEIYYGKEISFIDANKSSSRKKIAIDGRVFYVKEVIFYNQIDFYAKDPELYKDTILYGKNGFKQDGNLYVNIKNYGFLKRVYTYKNLMFYPALKQGLLKSYFYSNGVNSVKRVNRNHLQSDLNGEKINIKALKRKIPKINIGTNALIMN